MTPFWLPFGLRPSKDGVTITDHATFRATFGFLSIETPLTNIDEAHITRDYRWWTAPGARRSWVDDGLTFGTNNTAGVCVHFRRPVPSPLRRKGHSALTVTVADVDRLVLHGVQRGLDVAVPEQVTAKRATNGWPHDATHHHGAWQEQVYD